MDEKPDSIVVVSQISVITCIVKGVFQVMKEGKSADGTDILTFIDGARPYWMDWLKEQGCPTENLAEIMDGCERQAQGVVAQILLRSKLEEVASVLSKDFMEELKKALEPEKPKVEKPNRVSAYLN